MHALAAESRSSKRTAEPPLLEAAREKALLRAALQGDASAASELVQSHTRLVMKIAARYRRASLSWEDLVSEGVLGLMEAMRRFDVTQETRFAAYACWWIRARVSQYALDNRRLVRVPSTRNARAVARRLPRTEHRLSQVLARPPTAQELAADLGVSANEVAEVRCALGASDLSITPLDNQVGIQVPSDYENPEQTLERVQQDFDRSRRVRRALRKLSDRERQVICAQYFDEQGQTLSQLGAVYGVSRQRVGQMLCSARGKLKQDLEQVA